MIELAFMETTDSPLLSICSVEEQKSSLVTLFCADHGLAPTATEAGVGWG
jgi:hypothetical protein